MEMQNFEKKNARIHDAFLRLKKENPKKLENKLKLSWSNWGFGMEKLSDTAERLAKAEIEYIELHGNHYGKDLGYKAEEVLKILGNHGIKVAGICGMFSKDNDLSSNSGVQRQAAIDYLMRELDFASAVNASYILVVPGAVGRPLAYDDMEFERSVEMLRIVADEFSERKIKAAIEPIRSAEVSIVHTIDDAVKYIKAVNHPGIAHINGDVYHMQSEETHIGEAILRAEKRLVNLHMADSNRCALGNGSMDLDTIIKALYVIGFNDGACFVTPEPLGPGADPYPAMFGKPDNKILDELVMKTSVYLREREKHARELK
ncbi:MAG: sugar phosphate isomerase [Lentisphaerae bacterium GWF2_44_16]|nr:MAG: sugar phosphate isomerase [Lentisphaerae bacterium GWF2_44_16]